MKRSDFLPARYEPDIDAFVALHPELDLSVWGEPWDGRPLRIPTGRARRVLLLALEYGLR